MLHIDYKDSRSLHVQIEDGIRAQIISGALSEGDQLPSVRELSISLTVNPNTVQKAYKQLESDGYIYSVLGKGNFVSGAHAARDAQKIEALYKTLGETARALLYLGESQEEIARVISKIKEEF